eukprot:jgi/Botrbrau1/21892/Bobra.0249s0021.1
MGRDGAVVTWALAGPVRCGECKAYMNPHMQFIEGGRKFRLATSVTLSRRRRTAMWSMWAQMGVRRDADIRPELRHGTVEFVATAEYMVRTPMPPDTLVPSGCQLLLLLAAASLQLPALQYLASWTTYKRGACADWHRHLRHLHPVLRAGLRAGAGLHAGGSGGGSALLPPDLLRHRPPRPLPLPGGGAAGHHPKAVRRYPGGRQLWGRRHLCWGPSPQGGNRREAACVPGRDPYCRGPPAVPPEDQKAPPGDKDPQKLQEPESKDYKTLAVEAAEFQVCVDLVIGSPGYCDLATLRELCTQTAGQLYHYSPFVGGMDDDLLFNDLRWNVLRPQGWEAVGRLRCSAGLAVERYAGSFYRRTTTDLDFPALHSEHAFAIKLRHEEKLTDKQEVFFQFALLYSTSEGNRRIRVHTLGLPTTAVLASVFRGADLDAQIAWASRQSAASVASGASLVSVRDSLQKATVECLLSYRKNCASASSPGQLILPESLRLLPLYSNAVMKSPAFWAPVGADVRAAWLAAFLTAPVEKLLPLVYPRLFPLHFLQQEGSSDPELPEELKGLSAEKMDAGGIYLLENGQDAFISFAPHPDPMSVRLLLGVDSLDALPKGPLGLPILNNPFNRAVHAVLDKVRAERASFMRLRIVRRGDPTEAAFYNMVVEDRCQTGASYVEYLCTVHRLIQNKLS